MKDFGVSSSTFFKTFSTQVSLLRSCKLSLQQPVSCKRSYLHAKRAGEAFIPQAPLAKHKLRLCVSLHPLSNLKIGSHFLGFGLLFPVLVRRATKACASCKKLVRRESEGAPLKNKAFLATIRVPSLSMEGCLHVTDTFFRSNRYIFTTRTHLLVGSSFYKHNQNRGKEGLQAVAVGQELVRTLCHTPVWKYHSKSRYKTVRVLLKFSRRVVSLVCIKSKLPVYPDTSNRSIKYSRNRIRKQIVPSLQFFLNPQVENAILTFSELSKFELVN